MIESFDELYPGRFIKAGLFKGQPTTYTITNIDREELDGDKGEKEAKIVMSFSETPLQYILPKICAVCLKAMFGPSVPSWIGKRVTFYATTAIMPYPKKKDEPCIRVFGSPDIDQEVRCEWTPPRRKPVIQFLQPVVSPVLTAALAAIEAAPDADALGKIQKRADKLLSEGKINDKEHARIGATIAASARDQHSSQRGIAAPTKARPAVEKTDTATALAKESATPVETDGGDRDASGSSDPAQPAKVTDASAAPGPDSVHADSELAVSALQGSVDSVSPSDILPNNPTITVATVMKFFESLPTNKRLTMKRDLYAHFTIGSATTLADALATPAHLSKFHELLNSAAD